MTVTTMAVAVFLLCIGRVQLRYMDHLTRKKHPRLLLVRAGLTPASAKDCAGTFALRFACCVTHSIVSLHYLHYK